MRVEGHDKKQIFFVADVPLKEQHIYVGAAVSLQLQYKSCLSSAYCRRAVPRYHIQKEKSGHLNNKEALSETRNRVQSKEAVPLAGGSSVRNSLAGCCRQQVFTHVKGKTEKFLEKKTTDDFMHVPTIRDKRPDERHL